MPRRPGEFEDGQVLFEGPLEQVRAVLEETLGLKATAAGQILVSTGPGGMDGSNTQLLQIPQTGHGVLRFNSDGTLTLEQFDFEPGILTTDTRDFPKEKLPMKSWTFEGSGQIPQSELPGPSGVALNSLLGRSNFTMPPVPSSTWKYTGYVLPNDVEGLLACRILTSTTSRYTPASEFTWFLKDDLRYVHNFQAALDGNHVQLRYVIGNVVHAITLALTSGNSLIVQSTGGLWSGVGESQTVARFDLWRAGSVRVLGQLLPPRATESEMRAGTEPGLRSLSPELVKVASEAFTVDQTARDAATAARNKADTNEAAIAIIRQIQADSITATNLPNYVDAYALIADPTATIPTRRFGTASIPEQALSAQVRRKLNETRGTGTGTGTGTTTGGLAVVNSDGTLLGEGTEDDPLRVANPFSLADESKLDGLENYVLPAASSATRGGVRAITNAIIDAATSQAIYGWSMGHVRRLIEAIVPSWARQPSPPAAGDTLPDLPEDGHEYTLQGRDRPGVGGSNDPIRFWGRPNFVPNTPGTRSGIGHVLTVTGENDRDFSWRALSAALIRDALATLTGAARLPASAIKDLPTAGGAVRQTAEEIRDALAGLTGNNRLDASAIKNLPTTGGTGLTPAQAAQLERNTARTHDIEVLTEITYSDAEAADAGFTVFAAGTSVANALMAGTYIFNGADMTATEQTWHQRQTGVGGYVVARLAHNHPISEYSMLDDDVIVQIDSTSFLGSDATWHYYSPFESLTSNVTMPVSGTIAIQHNDSSTVTRYNGELGAGAGRQIQAAVAPASAAAAAAQLDTDTVIEIAPWFEVGESGAKNIDVNIRHPLNAYSDANIMSISASGSPPVLVTYDPTMLAQSIRVGIPAATIDSSGFQDRLVPGNYIDVEIRLTDGRNGPIHFVRTVDVPVEPAPSEVIDAAARSTAGSALATARSAAQAAATADSKAVNAQNTANTARTEAAAADTKATNAQTTANAAIPKHASLAAVSVLTQAQYDALTTKVATTLYVIRG